MELQRPGRRLDYPWDIVRDGERLILTEKAGTVVIIEGGNVQRSTLQTSDPLRTEGGAGCLASRLRRTSPIAVRHSSIIPILPARNQPTGSLPPDSTGTRGVKPLCSSTPSLVIDYTMAAASPSVLTTISMSRRVDRKLRAPAGSPKSRRKSSPPDACRWRSRRQSVSGLVGVFLWPSQSARSGMEC